MRPRKRMENRWAWLVGAWTLLLLARPAWAEEITLISAELPGGLFEAGTSGQFQGEYVQLFDYMADLAGVTIRYRAEPWRRAVALTESGDNLVLFPLTRTKEREHRFIWQAKLEETTLCFAANQKRVDSLAEARALDMIIVWQGTSLHRWLKAKNLSNLSPLHSMERIGRLMRTDRKLAWFTFCDAETPPYGADEMAFEMIVGDVVHRESLWLATSTRFQSSEKTKTFFRITETLLRDFPESPNAH